VGKINLTDRALGSLKPTKKGERRLIWDAQVPGLAVRITHTGRISFVFIKRYPGSPNPVPRKLGDYESMSLAEAREEARNWLKLIDKGLDPQTEKERQEEERRKEQQQRQQEELRKQRTAFAAVAEDFIKEKLPGERKGHEAELDIRREFIPAWGMKLIADISPADVREVVKAAKDRGAPYQAHNLLTLARRMFDWIIDQHVYGLETSPCDRLKPKALIGEKKARKRILSDDELRAFWRAAMRLPYPYGAEARLLLLIGQRHREVTDAKRSEFHPELVALIRRHAEAETKEAIAWQKVPTSIKIWSVGEERFKSDAPHMVPLSDAACTILETLPQYRNGEHLFSTTFGTKPTVISDKIKCQIDARMLCTLKALARIRGEDPNQVELKPWIIHDLRRCVRSGMSALKVQDHIAEMVIGHGRKGLQRVYDQHRYIAEMREALDLWSAHLRSIVQPAPATSNLIELSAARA
jgi:integrase